MTQTLSAGRKSAAMLNNDGIGEEDDPDSVKPRAGAKMMLVADEAIVAVLKSTPCI
jgi:hypothetical protein